ncbi:MAG: Uma2 family endonuclease [Chloroflexi bacterium]|nr:Uma2 family endonuclease [Chloroflexota bacterium]
MAMRLLRSGLTYEDYLQLPDDGQRYEIIDGELYVSPAPNIKHQTVSINLSTVLNMHVRAERLGQVLAAPTDVRFLERSTVQLDLLYISQARRGIITSQNVCGAPGLVVEIISPSSTEMDLEIKRDLYARHGVPYYWITHPQEESLRAYARGRDGAYERIAEGQGDMLFSAAPFPDLTIPLAMLWDA